MYYYILVDKAIDIQFKLNFSDPLSQRQKTIKITVERTLSCKFLLTST